jgi:hypothetical protein
MATRSSWKLGHPVTEGVYELSAKNRNPRPFETIPAVWLVVIRNGQVEALTPGMRSYPVTTDLAKLDEIKHRLVTPSRDPWQSR